MSQSQEQNGKNLRRSIGIRNAPDKKVAERWKWSIRTSFITNKQLLVYNSLARRQSFEKDMCISFTKTTTAAVQLL